MDEELKQIIEEIRKDIVESKDNFKSLRTELENRVTWKTFTWVLGILMAMTVGILGVIYSKVDNIDEKVNSTNAKVSSIEGFLKGVEIVKE